MFDPFNLQQVNKLSKSGQLKVKITEDVIAKDVCWYERRVITQNLNTYLYSNKKPQQKQLFLQPFLNHEKTNMAVIQIRIVQGPK